jgi:predicted homoserine dehydrogenase-like protein
MFALLDKLKSLDESIKIGIIGIGSIGKGMVLQSRLTPGIDCIAIADIDVKKAVSWAEYLKSDYQIVSTLQAMHDAVRRGKLAVCEDGNLIARCEPVDVLIESTNSIPAGGRYAITALENGKHLVMMNYEADLMFGPYLLSLAEKNKLVYTVCDGDQPAVLRRLIDEIEFMQLKLVMAGNIKGYLDRYVNPTSIIPEADKRKLDYKMCASYTDGTKLAIEMAVLANGLGLKTAVPGMHGPRAKSIYEAFDVFDFNSLWDGKQSLVDYILGAKPTGGVFAIGYTEDKYQQDTLAWFPPDMGPGPFYLFYRPYHLGHFETMASVAEAALHGRSVLKPDFGFLTNVYAYAKHDLQKGDVLDGIGGYASYGLIENCEDNVTHPGLPICLADDVTLNRNIKKDEKILLADVIYDPHRFDFELFFKAFRQDPERER